MVYNIDEDNIRTVIKACTLYYYNGLGQAEVAKHMGISRPQVSRMLAAARANRIVTVSITSPFSGEDRLEQRLKQKFNLHDATVINGEKTESLMIRAAEHVGKYLNAVLSNDDTLGVSPGNTVNRVCDCLSDIQARHVKVVPLCGALSQNKYGGQANLAAQNAAFRIGGEALQLYAPAFMSSEILRDALMQEDYIRPICESWNHLSAAVVGIGTLDPDATFIRSGLIQDEQVQELRTNGTFGGICNFFYDKEGKLVNFSAHSRMIGISAQEFRRIPHRIAVAYGVQKASAICCALRGGWVTTLVTSAETAEKILEL